MSHDTELNTTFNGAFVIAQQKLLTRLEKRLKFENSIRAVQNIQHAHIGLADDSLFIMNSMILQVFHRLITKSSRFSASTFTSNQAQSAIPRVFPRHIANRMKSEASQAVKSYTGPQKCLDL